MSQFVLADSLKKDEDSGVDEQFRQRYKSIGVLSYKKTP